MVFYLFFSCFWLSTGGIQLRPFCLRARTVNIRVVKHPPVMGGEVEEGWATAVYSRKTPTRINITVAPVRPRNEKKNIFHTHRARRRKSVNKPERRTLRRDGPETTEHTGPSEKLEKSVAEGRPTVTGRPSNIARGTRQTPRKRSGRQPVAHVH